MSLRLCLSFRPPRGPVVRRRLTKDPDGGYTRWEQAIHTPIQPAGHSMATAVLYELEERLAAVQDAVDEAAVLKMYSSESSETSQRLSNALRETRDAFSKARDTINSDTSTGRNAFVDQFNMLLSSYGRSLSAVVEQSLIADNDDEGFERLQISPLEKSTVTETAKLPSSTKSVRFKPELVELSPKMPFSPYRDDVDDVNDGTPLAPYRDDIDTLLDEDNTSEIDNPTIDMTDRQIFIHNEHQFEQQNRHLDQLHNSVKQQRQIALTINNEVNDQFELMDDLERNIEVSNARLIRSTGRIQQYREALRRRPDWFLIIVLTGILTFLLVVLK